MLRGVNWAAVAQYVDLADALPLPAPPEAGAGAAAGAASSPAAPPADDRHPGGEGAAAAAAALLPGMGQEPRRQAELAALGQQEELFEAAGWAAPSPASGGRSQRAQALADLG